jgi:hypothetical protein
LVGVAMLWHGRNVRMKLKRLDPDRGRRRAELLAEMAEAQALRHRVAPRRARIERLREIIKNRRRFS